MCFFFSQILHLDENEERSMVEPASLENIKLKELKEVTMNNDENFICEMILMLGQKLAVMTNKYTWHDQQRYWIILQLYTNHKWYYRTEWSPIQFVIILGINEAWAGFVNYEYEYS